MSKNMGLEKMVRHQLEEEGISPDKANSSQKGKAFGKVCSHILFMDIEPKNVVYPDGANDHGIDFYRVDDDGNIVIAQCKYNKRINFGDLLPELQKTYAYIKEICDKHDAHKEIKFNRSLDAFNGAVIRLYIKRGIEYVESHISYHFFMGTTANDNYKDTMKNAKHVAPFHEITIYQDKDIINLYNEKIISLQGVPKVNLGLERWKYEAGAIACMDSPDDLSRIPDNDFAKRILVAIPAKWFAEAIGDEHGRGYGYTRIFSNNVRTVMRNKDLSRQIDNTVVNKPTRFIDYSNGITAICSGYEIYKSPKGDKYDVLVPKDLVIVNGAQTVANIYEELQHKKDLSDVRIQTMLILEPDKNERKMISICRNSQTAVSNSDMRSRDENIMLLQEYLKYENSYLVCKSGEQIPEGYDKLRTCKKVQELIQFLTIFSYHQPLLARNCSAEILMDEALSAPMLNMNYAENPSFVSGIASDIFLKNCLKKASTKYANAHGTKSTSGFTNLATFVFGIYAEMICRASAMPDATFAQLCFWQPKILTADTGIKYMDPNTFLAPYDMKLNHEKSETVIDLLVDFMDDLYPVLESKSIEADLEISKGVRSTKVMPSVISELCNNLSRYTYETCGKEYPYLDLLKPYRK